MTAPDVSQRLSSDADRIPAACGMPEQFGRYQIVKRLGEGAMGAVYLAEDSQLERKVALKTPTFTGRGAGEMIERFYSEARSAATLRHPNICPVYDVGEIEGLHYISMAFIEGRMLSQYVRGDKQIPQRTAAALIRKLARALGHAHGEGIIHRDLKPGNVIIDRQNEPIVMDFGLARRVDQSDASRITQDGMILGTPAYMSPEQVGGDLSGTGPQSDIYSLGVMLYELLTGDVPFNGPIASVLGQIMTQEPQPPSSLREGLDPRLEAICLKMIAKKPADRYASMKEVSDALAGFLKGKSSLTRPAAGESRQGGRPKHHSRRQRPTQPAGSATLVGNDEMQALAQMFAAQSSDEHPAVEAVKHPRPAAALPKKLWIAVGAAVAACVLLAGIVISIESSKGTIKLEIPGSISAADLRITVDGDEYTLGRGGTITLPPGQHLLKVSHNGENLVSDTLLVVQGRIVSVAIPLPLPIANSPPDTDPSAGQPSSTDPNQWDDRSVAQWLFDTGSWIKMQTAVGRSATRWKKKGGIRSRPLPEEPFELTGISLYSGTNATDDDMRKLRNLDSLDTLNLGTASVTGKGLEQIQHLPRLTRLDIRKTPITGDDLRIVAGMKQLRSLAIRGDIENADLAHLSGMTWLTSLSINSKLVTDAGLEHLAPLEHLETLNVDYGPIAGGGLMHLNGMTKLRSLSLYSTGIVDAGLVHLEKLNGLQSVNLGSTRVTDAGMTSLARLPGLRKVILYDTVVGDEGMEHLGRLLQLTELNLKQTRVTSRGLAHLKDARKMTHLYLGGTQIDDEGLAHLRNITLLKGLEFAHTNVTGSGLAHLTHLGRLSRLCVGGTRFTDRAAAFEAIKQMAALSRLQMTGIELTDAERDDLTENRSRKFRLFAGAADDEEEDEDPEDELMPDDE